MRIINCPLCNSDDFILFCKKQYPESEYNVVKCNNCGFYYTNPEPSPSELLEFYNSDYLSKHENVWHEFEDKLNNYVSKYLVSKGIKSNLDLGSGQGRFVNKLKQKKIEVIGVEPVFNSCKIAKDKYSIDLVNQTCEEYLNNCSQKFNAITMLNVLEHLPGPSNIIQLAKKCLTPNGTLILVVPNVDFTLFLGSIRRNFRFKDRYMLSSAKFSQQGFDPPIHLSSFNCKSLTSLLEKNNFEIIKITNAPVIKSSSTMNFLKNVVYLSGKFIEVISLKKIIWGYSLLCISENEN